jgi:D-alanyl-D-alanine carboxypeptidase
MARRAVLALLVESVLVCGCVAADVGGEARGPAGTSRTVNPDVALALPGETAAPIADPAAAPIPAPTAPPTARPTPSPTPAATPTPSPTNAPSASPSPAVAFPVTNFAPLPACNDGSERMLLMASDQYSLMLIDKTYAVPKDYVPPDLVNVRQAGFGGSYQVRAVMIDDLKAMRIAAAQANSALAIFSAYRSYQEQVWSFGHWMRALGDAALYSSARPGHSEHQLGLAIDFKAYGGPVPWAYKDFSRQTAAGAWLAKNAWQYGFVMSYPWNKVSQVCYGYEPWHYRYVGRAAAAAIHASGQTARVWLWQHQPDQLWPTGATPRPAPTPPITPASPGVTGPLPTPTIPIP